MPRTLLLAVLAVCLSACARDMLYVQNSYINRDSLASSHVGTPDPALANPTLGQRLLVRWVLSKSDFNSIGHPELLLDLRFKSGQEDHIRFQLLEPRGLYTYQIVDEDFFNKGTIRTYQARIMDGDRVVARWRHQLWAERIEIGP